MNLFKILDSKPVPDIIDSKAFYNSNNTLGDYWLPTTMCLYQKELTDQIVSLHYSDILRYFETKDYKEDVVLQSMETMCMNSQLVATHPYLLIDHHMPKSLLTKDIPIHLAETSGKFAALRDLINIVQDYDYNVALICRPGRTMDLVEALLIGSKVTIKRYDGNSIKSKQKQRNFNTIFHVFPSNSMDLKKYPINVKKPFDLVIALDPSVIIEDNDVQKILQHNRKTDSLRSKSPLIRLTAINSIDHCELYFSSQFEKGSRRQLESTTAAVVVLRDRVGILPPDLRPVYSQKLRLLTNWIEDPTLSWPLPDVYAIKKYTAMDVEKSLLSEVHYDQTENTLEAAFTNSRKRGRTAEDRNATDKVPSFYDIKRIRNDYATNPLKQNMSQLTGITTANVASALEYHLSSGILTHKLIQEMNQFYVDLERKNKELQDYKVINSIQESHNVALKKDEKEVSDKLNLILDKISKNEEKADEADANNKSLSEQIEIYKKETEAYLNQLEEKKTAEFNLANLYLAQKNLDNELEKEQRLNEFKCSEKEYMETELKRAQDSVQETHQKLETIGKEMEDLKTNINISFTENAAKVEKTKEQLELLREQQQSEDASYEELQLKLEDVIERLNRQPKPRIRTTSNGQLSNNHNWRRSKART